MSQDGSSDWSEEGWREEILLRQLRLRCDVVKNLAQSLEHQGDFPTPTPERLCRLIKQTVDVLQKHISVTPHDQLATVNIFLCSIAQYLRFIERSRIINTPWSMIQATEQFLKGQVGPDSHFIIRPQWAYNYSLTGEFVEAFRTRIAPMVWIHPHVWEESIGTLAKERIYCMGFPRIERLNALLHANWGHELGHIIAAQWVHAKFGQIWSIEESGVKARIKEVVQQAIPTPVNEELFRDLMIDQYVSEHTKSAMDIAQDGLTELICDAIGVHLLGPSALAACIDFSAGFSLDESPLRCDRYPPWRYRLRLMVKACEKDLPEWKPEFDAGERDYPGETVGPFVEWLTGARHLVQQTSDLDVVKGGGVGNVSVREAYALIDKEWARIRAEVLDMLPNNNPGKPYRLCEHLATIVDLVDKLEHSIPPSEAGIWPNTTTASFEDIINAAWVFKAKSLAQIKDWGSTEDLEKLYRLVLKAIEASFVQSVFGPRLAALDTT